MKIIHWMNYFHAAKFISDAHASAKFKMKKAGAPKSTSPSNLA